MDSLNIGFIGTGNLAEALINGLLASSKRYVLRGVDKNPERLQAIAERYGVEPVVLPEVVGKSDVILLAVKPKDVVPVLKDLQVFDLTGKLILTVAAGIPIAVYEECLPQTAVVRCMPNTSSAVLHSVTGLAKGKWVDDAQARIAEEIFSQIGKTLWFDEQQMNAVTAISGSGPAYFYYFTECLIAAGIKLGLKKEDAEVLAIETLIGAGKMVAKSQKSPGELREAVTSPNGTTHAALTKFREARLEDIVCLATQAAMQRGYEMEGEFRK